MSTSMLDLEVIWVTLRSSHLAYFSQEMFGMVAYDPTLLYSTLIIAILLTKGYAKNIAMAVGRKLLKTPTKTILRTLRAVKPRQIMYYGLRWGIPLYQLKQLVTIHRNLIRRVPRGVLRSSKTERKTNRKTPQLNSTVCEYIFMF